jgi:tetratricopeptide (TPR) repeat protein
MDIGSVCPSCAFENPKAWRACAACGRPLGSGFRPTSVTGLGGADRTVVTGSADEPRTDPFAQAYRRNEFSSEGTVPELESDELDSLDDELDDDEPSGTSPELAEAEGDREPPLIGQADAALAVHTGIERAFGVGAPTLVALDGPRGAGKTRLLVLASELAARLDPRVRILYGSCREGGDGAYAPFSRLLLERFGVTPSSSPSAVRAQMTTVVRDALGTNDAVVIAETTHFLGHLAGIPFPDSPFLGPLENNPPELHARARKAFARLVEGEAQSRPVLVLLDNLQWAEDAAWDLLASLVGLSAHVAIVVAGDAIAERASKLEAVGGVAIGPIAPFGEADVQAMLHVLLPTLSVAPEPLVAALTHRSGGNPAALRELVAALWEGGLFYLKDGAIAVDLARLEAGDLPVTTADATRARLERLDPFERATLDRAAVVGEVFWDGAILGQMRSERKVPGDSTNPLGIWPDDDDAVALGAVIDRLVDKGFVERLDQSDLPGARELKLAIPGLRDLLYEQVDEATRTQRHGAVARWLALVGTLRREGVAAMIAPHLERAGQTARAGRAYHEAAVAERAQLRVGRALRFLERALQHIPSDDVVRRIEALHDHGSLLTTVGRYDEADHAFVEMLRLAWNIGARGKGGAALNRLARVRRARGEEDAARDLLLRALELFRAASDLRGVASTLDDLAQIALLRGETDTAAQAATEALEIRRAHADMRGEAVSLSTLGSVELRRGNLDAAEQLFSLALELRRQVGDREGLLQSHNALGVVAFERGERDRAVTAWRSALEQAREIGDRRSECFLLNNVGEARILDGVYDEAEVALERALSLAEEHGDKRALADIARNLGALALKRGDDDAGDRVERAYELAREYGGKEAVALAQRVVGSLRAQTLFDTGGASDRSAEEAYLASIDLFREVGNEREAARSLVSLANHLTERGELDAAKERLREARATFRRLGLTEDALEVDRTLNELGA